MTSTLLSQILELSPAERVRLAQDIWESVSELPDADILTEDQKHTLDTRLKALEQSPDAGIPWRTLLDELREKL